MTDEERRAPLTDEEVRKVIDDDQCPRCGQYSIVFVSTHERDSTNDYRRCTKCEWYLPEHQVCDLHAREMEAIRARKT